MSVHSTDTLFEDPFSQEVWEITYKDYKDTTLDDTFRRVAEFVASAEQTEQLRQEWTERFYQLLSGFNATAGGRIYSNAGTEWNGTTLMNCFVGPRVNEDSDSLNGIFAHLQAQSQTLKSEGGWGENFSYIRPRGSFIHGIGVETPGAVKYMEAFDKMSEIITSGSGKSGGHKKAKGKIRKGAMMGVIDVWHPDVVEFIAAKQSQGRLSKFNVSVNCSDEFMAKINKVIELQKTGASEEEIYKEDTWELRFPETTHERYNKEWDGHLQHWIEKGYPVNVHKTVSAMWLWNLIMESTYNRAEPGVLFLDRANYYNPLSYKETIQATNPSMPAGMLVHTKTGIVPIEQLEGQTFSVKSLNGEWAPAECFLSGNDEPILDICLGTNKHVFSTKEHRWPVYDTRMKRIYKAYAHELKPGDLIPLNRNEDIGIYGDMSLTRNEGFLVGYIVGDGWISQKDGGYSCGITFGKHESRQAERVLGILNGMKDVPSTICEQNHELTIQFSSNTLVDKLFNRYGIDPSKQRLPSSIWLSNDEYIKGFVDGLLSADGSVFLDDNNQRLVLTTSRETLAQEFGKLLGFAGIPTSIWHTTTNSNFPNGKSGQYDRWDVAINGKALVNFVTVFGLSHYDKSHKLDDAVRYVLEMKRDSLSLNFAKVHSVKSAGRTRVWDISVYHDQHVFPTEWCYTGNCGEQTLAPGGVCNLGSLNLTQFVSLDRSGFDLDRLAYNAKVLVRFLDNINTVSQAPLPSYERSMKEKRRVGCGILGWGSALFMLKVKFGSKRANELREQVMSTIAKAAYKASIELAEEKGMFKECIPEKHAESPFIVGLELEEEWMDRLRKTGIRNSSVLSIQPTGNTSIFANVVSGGLEPIFMPEYIRTVIVNQMPEHIAHCTPKWYEGEMVETEMFKWTKEGEEDILRGVDEHGTVYKIDTNRGLTKEVLCEDYGVRFLKRLGEWNPKAKWAVTTSNLSVDDHVNDLTGFARWIDSAVSKTINVPNDYPFEDFKNIYLDAYNSGYVKGVTTYRAGTMMSVLSMKEEKDAEQSDEEIILEDVKLPDSAPAAMKTLRAEGRKWYVTVVTHEGSDRPFAIFVKTNDIEKTVIADAACDALLALARRKGIPTRHIEKCEQKIRHEKNSSKIARLISFNLRHGVLIKNIVAVLDKIEEAYVGTFVFAIKKFLSQYIKDGEKVEDEKCLECGSDNVVFREGCKLCLSCGSSKCG